MLYLPLTPIFKAIHDRYLASNTYMYVKAMSFIHVCKSNELLIISLFDELVEEYGYVC